MKRFLLALTTIAILTGCAKQQLETGLPERDAQEIVGVLLENGIKAELRSEPGQGKGGPLYGVLVKGGDDQIAMARRVLRENGLPREHVAALDDLFKSSGVIPTATEERAKLMAALAGENARTLRSQRGIVDAHVQVVTPDNANSLDPNEQSPATASVLLSYRGDSPPLTNEQVSGLVAKGVPGLSPQNVFVVQTQASEKALSSEIPVVRADKSWITVDALTLSGITGAGALSLLTVSKRRAQRIKSLERQLAQAAAGGTGGLSRGVA